MNHELYELFDDIDIVKRIKIQRLRWLGHVVRMDKQAPAKRVFESDPKGGARRRGRPNIRWQNQLEENIASLGIANWRQSAGRRTDWRNLLNEAKTNSRLSSAV